MAKRRRRRVANAGAHARACTRNMYDFMSSLLSHPIRLVSDPSKATLSAAPARRRRHRHERERALRVMGATNKPTLNLSVDRFFVFGLGDTDATHSVTQSLLCSKLLLVAPASCAHERARRGLRGSPRPSTTAQRVCPSGLLRPKSKRTSKQATT